MKIYKTPGVYVEEISTLPPSVAEVSTAIPAFFGYTDKGPPIARIESLLEFTASFGGAKPTGFVASTATDPATGLPAVTSIDTAGPAQSPAPDRLLYYAVSHYFANGGGPCHILSLGDYSQAVAKADFLDALDRLALEDEPTLIVLTDAVLLKSADYFEVVQKALAQCAQLQDRFVILDVPGGDVGTFRNGVGTDYLSYAAAYHPYLRTSLNYVYDEKAIQVKISDAQAAPTVREASFPAGANSLIVSFTGADSATPKVQIVAADPVQDAAFAITAAKPTLVISNAGGKTAKQIFDKWAAFKAANAASGFDLRIAGDGSANVAPTPAGDGADLAKVGGGPAGPQTLADLRLTDTARYNQVKSALSGQRVTLPPSAAMAGIFARVDRDRPVGDAGRERGRLGGGRTWPRQGRHWRQ